MAEEKKLNEELLENLSDELTEDVVGGVRLPGKKIIKCSACGYSAWDYVWIGSGGNCPKCGKKAVF